MSLESSANGKWKLDANSFIFSLTNKENRPLKMKIDPKRRQHAIGCHSDLGPTFGYDICLAYNANTTMRSFFNLGRTFKHPHYSFGSNLSKRI